MNRRIKFRFWNKIKNIMGEPVSLKFLIENAHGGKFNKEEYEPMQFTGLHDFDGTEIYEGDILKVEVSELREKTEKVGKVVFENGTFGMTNCLFNFSGQEFLRPLCDLSAHPTVHFKIIGNIFENTELLEK